MNIGKSVLATVAIFVAAGNALGHDIWVETNVGLVRVGDFVSVDLKLGNHGNDHRDFKLASKVSSDYCTLEILSANGGKYDLKERIVDCGYAPKEGYWSANFTPAEPGLYCVVTKSDQVVNHGKPARSIRSAKAYFLAAASLDNPKSKPAPAIQKLGLPIEIVLESDPVVGCGPEKPVLVQLLFKGAPLANAKVSFVPRGGKLKDGFDKTYERTTDSNGRAKFVPKEGNAYLIVAHHKSPNEKAKEYESTQYSATLTLRVPQICPCCGD